MRAPGEPALLYVVAGKKGSGKTTWLRRAYAKERRLIVVDPLGEHAVGGVAKGRREALLRVVALGRADPGELCRVSLRVTHRDADEVLRACFALQPGGRVGADPEREWCIVVDEADMVSAPGDKMTGMDILVNYGRHIYSKLYLATRRPHRLSRDATANADVFVLFRTHEPRDVKWVQDALGPARAEEVRKLRPFRPLVAAPGEEPGRPVPAAGNPRDSS